MNIYALRGHKVRVVGFYANATEQEIKKWTPRIGQVYTVERTDVHSWSTDVYIQEFPDENLTNIDFEDVVPQSPQDDIKHPDWRKYNS